MLHPICRLFYVTKSLFIKIVKLYGTSQLYLKTFDNDRFTAVTAKLVNLHSDHEKLRLIRAHVRARMAGRSRDP